MYPGMFMYTAETNHLIKFIGCGVIICGLVGFRLCPPELYEDKSNQLTFASKYIHMHTHIRYSSAPGIIFWRHTSSFLHKRDVV